MTGPEGALQIFNGFKGSTLPLPRVTRPLLGKRKVGFLSTVVLGVKCRGLVISAQTSAYIRAFRKEIECDEGLMRMKGV